jgi:hypothetical protein
MERLGDPVLDGREYRPAGLDPERELAALADEAGFGRDPVGGRTPRECELERARPEPDQRRRDERVQRPRAEQPGHDGGGERDRGDGGPPERRAYHGTATRSSARATSESSGSPSFSIR